MAEDRMLSDEILLGLIKANSGGGGGGTSNYNDLSNKPQIGGVTLSGNKSASDLGLVAAVDGKGLSTNDYTDADKAIVGGVTAALAGKQGALTAGNNIKIDNDTISVNRWAVPAGKVVYTVITSDENYGQNVHVQRHTLGGAFIDDRIFLCEMYKTVDIDGLISIQNPYASFNITLLKDSDEQQAGYRYTVNPITTPTSNSFTFTMPQEENANDLIIRSELDAEVNAIKDGTNIDSFADVESALADKQDKTDNSLQTTDKTVVGAINEHEGDIDSLKSGLINMDTEVNGDATVYPYADVITIEDAVPSNLAECNVKIDPVQSGSGDPSPENIRPITGYTEASVERTGANIFDPTTYEIFDLTGDGTAIRYGHSFKAGSYHIVASEVNSFNYRIVKEDLSDRGTTISVSTAVTDITVNSGYLLWVFTGNAAESAMAKVCVSILPITDYVPYVGKTYTIALGDTIYGGTVDFDSGVMTVTRKCVDLGSLNFTYDENQRFTIALSDMKSASIREAHFITSCYLTIDDGRPYSQVPDFSAYAGWGGTDMMLSIHDSRYSDAATYKTAITGQTICYELATPTTIQLTPQQIQLLKGTNTLTASTGQISVTVNGVSGSIGSVQEQVNDHEERIEDVESDFVSLFENICSGVKIKRGYKAYDADVITFDSGYYIFIAVKPQYGNSAIYTIDGMSTPQLLSGKDLSITQTINNSRISLSFTGSYMNFILVRLVTKADFTDEIHLTVETP